MIRRMRKSTRFTPIMQERLRAWMDEADHTQTSAAAEFDIAQVTVSRWLGDAPPDRLRLDHAEKLQELTARVDLEAYRARHPELAPAAQPSAYLAESGEPYRPDDDDAELAAMVARMIARHVNEQTIADVIRDWRQRGVSPVAGSPMPQRPKSAPAAPSQASRAR